MFIRYCDYVILIILLSYYLIISTRNIEIPIHITPRSTSPDINASSSGFITRPFSSSSSSSSSSPTTVTSGSRYIPVTHQAPPPPTRSSNFNSGDYGSGLAKFTTTPSSRIYTNPSSSPSSLLDKFRKNTSYYDPYVPAFSSPPAMSLYDDGSKFTTSKGAPYSTTYRSSYGRF